MTQQALIAGGGIGGLAAALSASRAGWEVRLYERLYTEAQPDGGARDHLASLNPDSKRVIEAWVEPTVNAIDAGDALQFERHGYFVPDRCDSQPGRLVFNRSVSLKDTRAKGG